jgi:cytochrome P450
VAAISTDVWSVIQADADRLRPDPASPPGFHNTAPIVYNCRQQARTATSGSNIVTLSADARSRMLASRKQGISVALTPDVYPWYRQLRDSPPLVCDERRAAWLVSRYADVQHVLLDTKTFSSQRALKPDGTVDEIGGAGILGMDPPRHRHLRSLIAQSFTHKRIRDLEPRVQQITTQLLDELALQPTADLVAQLAFPLPIMVIAELLGVPLTNSAQFRSWAADTVGSNYERRMQAITSLAGFFAGLVAARQQGRTTNLISDLVHTEVDGARLSRDEVVGACLLLLVAGHETTTLLIGNALWCFEDHPDAQARVTSDPKLLATALEEVLRYRGGSSMACRVS